MFLGIWMDWPLWWCFLTSSLPDFISCFFVFTLIWHSFTHWKPLLKKDLFSCEWPSHVWVFELQKSSIVSWFFFSTWCLLTDIQINALLFSVARYVREEGCFWPWRWGPLAYCAFLCFVIVRVVDYIICHLLILIKTSFLCPFENHCHCLWTWRLPPTGWLYLLLFIWKTMFS